MIRKRYIIYSIIPAVLLFSTLELFVRILDVANPNFITAPLPDEFQGFTQPHDELFWSTKPNFKKIDSLGNTITINSLGFRGEELDSKRDNEFRIISLGESTTFGAGVNDHESYSYLLAEQLDSLIDSPILFNVLNCGFSAYSSFQSFKYLELYGLSYEPDMVILYNEVNDYLPSTLRSSGFNESTSFLSDPQLYNSRVRSFSRKIINKSKLLSYLSLIYARNKIIKLTSINKVNPLNNIGLNSRSSISNRLYNLEESRPADFNEMNLGQRVTEAERYDILKNFVELCQSKNLIFVLIHPSYLNSNKHECLLTQFCNNNEVPYFESFNSLHSQGQELYIDTWHPNIQGHKNIARDLAKHIVNSEEFKASLKDYRSN